MPVVVGCKVHPRGHGREAPQMSGDVQTARSPAMTAKPECNFPTIADLRDGLTRLVNGGLGDLPVQVLVVPASTMQAIALSAGHVSEHPALMIELDPAEGSGRLPAQVLSADHLKPYPKVQ